MKPTFLICTAVLTSAIVAGPARCDDSQSNRWLVSGAPDPAIVQSHDGDGYYVFSTARGIAIWHSDDLQTWTRRGRVFEDAVPAWAKQKIPDSGSIWAPDIHRMGGRYYLYYSVSSFGSQRSVIGLATNTTLNPDSPAYRWEDQGVVIESFPARDDYNAIDPALFVDDNGRAFLFWGSYWTGIKATEVDTRSGKPLSLDADVTSIARRAEGASTAIEGAYVIKHDGVFYLFVSWDSCCAREKSTYKMMVGRSRSILGPYIDDSGRKMTEGGGRLLLMSDQRWRGPGHNSVLQTEDGDFLAYHVIDAKSPHARILQIRSMNWKDGWPVAGQLLTHSIESAEETSPLVGRWDHTVNGRDHYDIFLEPTGEITGGGEAFWDLNGDELRLNWKSPRAPDGFWIDRVRLNPNRRSYQGMNQQGVRVEGRRR